MARSRPPLIPAVLKGAEAQGNSNSSSGINMNGEVIRLCKQGRVKEALHVLHEMDQRGVRSQSSTYSLLLDWCVNSKALAEGKLVHAHMIDSGLNPDIFLGTKLVTMYAKCGSLADARQILDKMPQRNVVSWTAMIAGYVRYGFNKDALEVYRQMQRDGIQPNNFTFSSVIPACANLGDLNHGEEVHGDIIRSGFQSDIFVESALVNMYVKCGRLEIARRVFDEMPERNVVAWTAMAAGYAQSGRVNDALKLFQEMPERNAFSWTAMIVGNARNGQVHEARKFFEKMPERNEVSWTVIIAGYAQNGYPDETLKLFRQMQLTGVKPDSVTFTSVLPACASLETFGIGTEIHVNIIKTGLQSHVSVGSALVDMYAKCGRTQEALQVFDKMHERNVVSWTAMLVGYAQNGQVDEALKLFQKISEQDIISWNAMVAGYVQNGRLDEALKLFQEMPQRNTASWTAMIAGYAQNEYVDKALILFEKMAERDVISWNAMIVGYAQNGYFKEALKLFRQMQLTPSKPDSVTFTTILPTCANLAALINGKEIHANIIRSGFQFHISVGSALVDMYAKCGTIGNACQVFEKMPERDIVSWNAMILGHAKHGSGSEALQLFEQMEHYGMKPNYVTFIGVMSACSHAGLVDDGWQYFERMSQDYHITPTVEHYCCMVDILGRAGQLDEAQDLINKMSIQPDVAVWGSLLCACRTHGNIKLGEWAAEHLFELDPKNSACYVMLSNIYAAAGRWDDVANVRKMMKDRKVEKIPGCSWIEVNNRVHSFLVSDRSHPQTHKIYAELERLLWEAKEAGYVPDRNLVLHDVEEEQKEHILCHHSEKLAIVFGLISTAPGTSIRIVKNLRVCGDCHSATKFISRVVAREIVLRDPNRFHHFKNGQCSCGDYW